MRYRTKDGLLIEAETSLDVVRRLREASWGEQNLSDQAFMEAVADRMYQQGIHVSTVSADIFVAGLLIAGLLAREIGGARSNETGGERHNGGNCKGQSARAARFGTEHGRHPHPRHGRCGDKAHGRARRSTD